MSVTELGKAERVRELRRTLGPDERVGAEVGDAALGVDERDAVGREELDAGGCTAKAVRVGLLGQVEVREHDVARLVQEDVCARA